MSKSGTLFFFYLLTVWIWTCGAAPQEQDSTSIQRTTAQMLSLQDSLEDVFLQHSEYFANGFDFPVGKPDGKGYYNAQGFRKNNHLGDDWNGRGGGNTDFGDTIYSIANGYVLTSMNFFGGWGKVLRCAHAWKEKGDMKMVESLYAHMDRLLVKKGQWVKRGDPIGTIGNAEGKYLAHLHLEIRDHVDMELGGGYGEDATGYVNPTTFISAHRKIPLSE